MNFNTAKAANPRRRICLPGLPQGVAFADAGSPTIADVMAKMTEVHAAHAAFKAAVDAQLADLKKGKDDVVTRNTVDKINDDIERLTAECSELNNKLAASRGRNDGDETPEASAHRKAFRNFVRKGVDNGLHDLAIKATLATDTDPDGGFVVPTEVDRTITRVLGAQNGLRSVAQVQGIGTDTFKKFKNLGGGGCGWVAERETRTTTNTPTLAALEYAVHEMYSQPVATQKMLDDAFLDVEAWLASEAAINFADTEGVAFISGDGVGKPHGLFGSAYGKAASSAASPSAWGKLGFTVTGAAADFATTSTTVSPADAFMALIDSLKPGYLPNSGFMMNRATRTKVRQFKDAQGLFLWQPSIAVGQPDTLLGYGITIDDNVDSVGANKFPVAFGDFRQAYLILDRFGTRLLRDPYSSKGNVQFYMTRRVAGGVQDYHAVKFLKCSN